MQATAAAATFRQTLVPPPVRLGLSRAEAAEYIGVGVTLFDQMVADGRMPKPKLINSRKVWNRHRLDEAFSNFRESRDFTSDHVAFASVTELGGRYADRK
jgi:predicted DNA-binding transcriptional regulator AlpA